MKTVICDLCHAVGADSYIYARGFFLYERDDGKIPDYEVDLCTICVVKLYKNLLRQLQLNGDKLLSGFLNINEHVDSIKTLIKCPATDVSTYPPPMK